MGHVKRISYYLEYLSLKLLILLLIIMMSLVALSVVGRIYTFMSVTWCQEVSNMCFIWLGFIGASVGVKHKTNFTVQIIKNQLNKTKKLKLNLFVDLSLLVVAGVMFFYGIEFTKMGGQTISAMTGITFFWTYISVPISAVFIIVYVIDDILVSVQSLKSQST